MIVISCCFHKIPLWCEKSHDRTSHTTEQSLRLMREGCSYFIYGEKISDSIYRISDKENGRHGRNGRDGRDEDKC